ncbi:unnamed protein product [Cyclocybe aegerita]|uniref:Uncharacterized protein n=1 Tax=Cyclocybe aegerita TaxID=1973307 RepID=A0A8S0VQ24_CYCAE|nr:unnamed protein product [Cyclocybe aegerita]
MELHMESERKKTFLPAPSTAPPGLHDPMSTLQVPPKTNPGCAVMARFPVPPLYRSRTSDGETTDLLIFGFSITNNFLLDFCERNRLAPNEEDAVRRLYKAHLHIGYTIERKFDAHCVDLVDDDPDLFSRETFCVAVTSNRTNKHLKRMQTYPHLEKLAEFLGLPVDAAEWMYPDRADALQVIQDGIGVI